MLLPAAAIHRPAVSPVLPVLYHVSPFIIFKILLGTPVFVICYFLLQPAFGTIAPIMSLHAVNVFPIPAFTAISLYKILLKVRPAQISVIPYYPVRLIAARRKSIYLDAPVLPVADLVFRYCPVICMQIPGQISYSVTALESACSLVSVKLTIRLSPSYSALSTCVSYNTHFFKQPSASSESSFPF